MLHRIPQFFLAAVLLWLGLVAAAKADPALDIALPPPPTGNAAAYLLMDAHSGSLLASYNIDAPLAPASLTKMMTVYVAGQELRAGRLRLDDTAVVGEHAWRMGGSRMYLDLGSTVSISDLLHGIIVQSGNDAAVALAEHIAGSEHEFVRMMNDAAVTLGMTNTRFTNCNGMPHKDMHTTARDLGILSQALVRDHPDLYALHSTVYFEYNNIRQRNRNQLLRRNASVDGIKTGYTKSAGYCLASSAKRGEMRLIAVVLGAENIAARTRLSEALLEYGFTWFETRKVSADKKPLGTVRVWKARDLAIPCGVAQDLFLTLPRGMFDLLQQDVSFSDGFPLVAPVHKYQKLGSVILKLGDEPLFSYDLVSLAEAKQASLVHRLVDSARLMLHSFSSGSTVFYELNTLLPCP
ncbi:MAG TPA: D-alanyl-D-alanine carboxypeptidase [Desulfonatronum sp.]|nr:D-alanyl-D-alanine carboxypeptidase [Desulfonatronum sp.]